MNDPARKLSPSRPSPAERPWTGLFRDSPTPMATADAHARRIVEANPALEALLGVAPGGLEGRPLADLDLGSPGELDELIVLALACGDRRPRRRRWWGPRGSSLGVEVSAARLDEASGPTVVLFVTEVGATGADDPATGPADLQAWMTRKHEAVAGLATGFAGELERILARAVGSAEALQAGALSPAATHVRVGEILGAAREARALVRELLAFTGRQVMEFQPLDLNRLVTEAEEDLREGLTQEVGLLVRPCPGPAPVRADARQVRQVLAHLVENARAAMPEGGYVVVATEAVELDEAFARLHPSTRPGPHVLLAVSDSGEGMDEETRARIFEPFFSTRRREAGRGMGLATVYGIVKQLGGSIWATSRPGVGTTFRIYLPRAEE